MSSDEKLCVNSEHVCVIVVRSYIGPIVLVIALGNIRRHLDKSSFDVENIYRINLYIL